MIRKNGSIFSCKRIENVKCTAPTSESKDDVSELICVFVHFFLSFFFGGASATFFTKPEVTSDLLDKQTSGVIISI